VKIIGRDPPARDALRKFWEIPRPIPTPYCGWKIHSGGVKRGAKLKKDDARLAVLSEYDGWAKDHPNDAKMMGGFVFFSYLQKEKPDLLDFRGGVGSKWQIVHLWLRHAGRLEI